MLTTEEKIKYNNENERNSRQANYLSIFTLYVL